MTTIDPSEPLLRGPELAAEVRVMPRLRGQSRLPGPGMSETTELLCPFFKTPAKTMFMSTKMGAPLSRAGQSRLEPVRP